MNTAGLPAPAFEFDGFFTVTLRRYDFANIIKAELKLNDKRGERIAFILRQLTAGNFNVEKAALEMNTTARTIRNDLDILVKQEWVKISGATKDRRYELTVAGKEMTEKHA